VLSQTRGVSSRQNTVGPIVSPPAGFKNWAILPQLLTISLITFVLTPDSLFILIQSKLLNPQVAKFLTDYSMPTC
jgi:hypothetical protein